MMIQPSKETKELWKKFDACKDKNKKKEILRQIDELTAKESVENDLFSRINLEYFNKLLTNVQKNKTTYLIKDADGSIGGRNTYARILIKRKPNDITYLSGVHLVTHRFKSPTEAYDIE